MSIFQGLSAFPLTPSDTSGRVVTDELAGLVRRIAAGGANSVGLLGSTGTYMFLNREERRRAVAVAVANAGSVPVIVGVGAMRTDAAFELARDAAAEGAAGLLLAPVSYTQLTEEEVFGHFEEVARATDLPVCIYSNPSTTNFTFRPQFVSRMASIPLVAAIKLPIPAGDVAADLSSFRTAAPSLAIGYSGDWGCKDALLAGADCWFSVVGGLFPELALALTEAARSGDRAAADRHDAAFHALWEMFQTHGSLRIIHEAAQVMGLTEARLPLPLLPLDDDLRRRVVSALPRAV